MGPEDTADFPLPEPETLGPQLEDGWIRLAFEMSRALLAALGGYEGVIFEIVLEESWGIPWLRYRRGDPDPKPVPVKLCMTELGRRTGLSRTRLHGALAKLVTRGLLVRHEDGSVEPSKRYWSWDCPFLGRGAMLDYCSAGANVLGDVRRGDHRGPVRPEKVSAFPDTYPSAMSGKADTYPKAMSGNPDTSTEKVSRKADTYSKTMSGKADTLPVEVSGKADTFGPKVSGKADTFPRASIELIQRKREGEEFAPAPAGESVRKSGHPDLLAGAPTRREQMMASIPGALDGDLIPDPAALDQLRLFADKHFPMRADIQTGIRLRSRQIETSWMLKAMKRLVAQMKHEQATWLWIENILRDWLRAGQPNRGPEDRFDDQMRELPPSQRPGGAVVAGRLVESEHEPNMPPPGGWPKLPDGMLDEMRRQRDEQERRETEEAAKPKYNPNFQKLVDAARAAGKEPKREWVEAAAAEARKLVASA